MHMSSLAARRTPAGKRVVHGMHTVLAALDSAAAASRSLGSPAKLNVRFLKPVYVGDTVAFLQTRPGDVELRLQALVDDVAAVDLRLSLGDGVGNRQESRLLTHDETTNCRDLSLTEMRGRSGTVRLATTVDKMSARFPHAADHLGASAVGALLCLSRLVGMECPGLHSLFSEFEIQFTLADPPDALHYNVASIDDRFRLLEIEVGGLGIRGRVEAFARTPPTTQASMQEVSSLVGPKEFVNQRALVVGGSRGLGELTAKVLAAGGGQPVITYAVGREDAERVAAEITQHGGYCSLLRYDVQSPPSQQLASLTDPISSLYYYATCQIFRRSTKRFDSDALEEFLNFYVRGFYDLCCFLKASPDRRIAAFYPSSVAVVERPRDMTEYSMAKAAAEILCSDLNRSWPGLHVTTVRLPRLLTDQTTTVVPARSENALEVVLPIIRGVQNFGL